ncbi:MAG: multidrug efflux system membrane fusion protein [Glaciecola sp.]|jgi:multidrug efflux system membrane fusion protein
MKKPYIIALVFIVLLCTWMLSGLFVERDEQSNNDLLKNDQLNGQSDELFSVEVARLTAQNKSILVTAQGQAEPNRVLTIRSQTKGTVVSVKAQEGQAIATNDLIISIDIEDRMLKLEQQQASLRLNQKIYEGVKRLQDKKFQSEGELESAFANLKTSETNVANIQRDIKNTKIVSPLSGILEKRLVEEGDFVEINTPIATVVENHPLIVLVAIAQQDIANVEKDMTAQINFANGAFREGKVRYISPRANSSTRTFNVEIEIDNANGSLRSGLSAQAKIPTKKVYAHYLSPALFSLSDSGDIGVKTVNDQDLVEFYPVELVQSDTNGAWVTGLPNTANVIITGQGFVKAGNKVKSVTKQAQ